MQSPNPRSQYDKALGLLQAALEIQEGVWGHDHPKVAEVKASLAQCYASMGRYKDAEQTFKEALSMQVGKASIWDLSCRKLCLVASTQRLLVH